MPIQDKLNPNSLLGQALYALVAAARSSNSLPENLVEEVERVRNVLEGHPFEASLQNVLAHPLDDLEVCAELRPLVQRLRKFFPGKRDVPQKLAPLKPLRTTEDGHVVFACPGCGSDTFRFRDSSKGELGERFQLWRKPGPEETMWYFSFGSRKGALGEVVCAQCSLSFDAETGLQTGQPRSAAP